MITLEQIFAVCVVKTRVHWYL